MTEAREPVRKYSVVIDPTVVRHLPRPAKPLGCARSPAIAQPIMDKWTSEVTRLVECRGKHSRRQPRLPPSRRCPC